MSAETYPIDKWTIQRCDTGEFEEVLIQRGRFWCTKDSKKKFATEPETAFDKRRMVG
jgi:hypothetical protein